MLLIDIFYRLIISVIGLRIGGISPNKSTPALTFWSLILILSFSFARPLSYDDVKKTSTSFQTVEHGVGKKKGNKIPRYIMPDVLNDSSNTADM